MKRPVYLTAALLLLVGALVMTGCVSTADVIARLEGTWKVVDKPSGDAWSPLAYVTFSDDGTEYQLLDHRKTMFERGSIQRLQSYGYYYRVVEYVPDPFYEGNLNYAGYTISGDELTITFYADSSKSRVFGTVVARKSP